MTTATKALRSDARRNRERLVASARELFARDGADVSVEEITRHAGVGMGTLYRHFPTKEDLLDAVLEDAFAEVLRYAEDGAADDDAWRGFVTFLERLFEMHADNRSLKDMIAARGHGAKGADKMRRQVRPLVHRMVERAQEQGMLRADFVPTDIQFVFWSTGRVIEVTSDVARDSWRRYLAFLLDGLRAQSATQNTTPPLSRSQFERIQARRR